MYCKSCGESLKAGVKFCGKCGTVVEVAAPEGMRCPKCGAVNKPGAKFCRQDGTPLVDALVSAREPRAVPSVVEPAVSSPAPFVRPVSHEPPPAEPAPRRQTVQTEAELAPSTGGTSRLWLAVGALAVLAAAGGGYWYYKSRGASPTAAETAQAPASQAPETAAAPEPERDVVEPSAQTKSETPPPVQSQVADSPQVSVGDRWVTEVVDHQDAKLNYRAERTVTGVGNDRIVTSVRTVGKDYVRSVEYSGQWALMATHLPSGATTTYSPALPYLSFPLEPGRSWQASVTETDAEGKQRVHEVRARMEAWETVQVPAGTFNALKVVLTDDISKDGVVVQQGQDVSWYAPDVKRTVKTEETSFDPATGERRRRTILLVEYALNGESRTSSAIDIGTNASTRPEVMSQSNMPDDQAAVLQTWLGRKAGFRPARAEDCGCDESLQAIRQSSWTNPEPYYVEADFNGDGHKDFAVVLLDANCTVENWQGCDASLAVFNGPWRKGMSPAFLQQVGTPRGALLYHDSEVPLLIGPWESRGSLLVAKADGYTLDGGSD